MDSPAFLDQMMRAVELSHAGLFFEEGGCFGMALALHVRLTELGLPSRLAYSEDCGHAKVHLPDGIAIDHMGLGRPDMGAAEVADRAAMLFIAEGCGWSEAEITEDETWAGQIIATAEELALDAAALPAP